MTKRSVEDNQGPVFMDETRSVPLSLSFVVPAHNEERELPVTLTALRQAASGVAHEIVVVDDASTDRTAEIAREFGARVISIDRRQIAAARNAGANAARGPVLVFVDADTRILPAHVSGVLAAIEQGYIGGASRLKIEDEIPRWGAIFVRCFTVIYFGLRFGAGAFLFARRDVFAAIGGFDEKYFAGEEVSFSIALRKAGPFKILVTPALTSGRKLRLYSGWEVLRSTVSVVCGGPQALHSRTKLAIWYDSRARETN